MIITHVYMFIFFQGAWHAMHNNKHFVMKYMKALHVGAVLKEVDDQGDLHVRDKQKLAANFTNNHIKEFFLWGQACKYH